MTNYLNTAVGHLPSGEQFMFTMHTSDGGGGTLEDMLSSWTSAIDALWVGNGTTVAGIHSLISTQVGIDTLRTASLNAGTGRQDDAVEGSVSHLGTEATAVSLPQEVAVAVTVRGAATNRRDRGRFFLPPLHTGTVTATARVSSVAAGLIADAAQLMLQSLDTDSKPAGIWHRSTLTLTPIVRLDVGDVFDAQRRRRDKLIEVRTARTL